MGVAGTLLVRLSVAVASVVSTQIGYLWNFDELMAKADLVIIAEHVATKETGDRIDHPELRPALPVMELQTEMNVLTVVKAEAQGRPAAGAAVRLKHYRVDFDEWKRRHPPQPGLPPPGLVNAGTALDLSHDKGPYLMFLRRMSTDIYEPLSGYTFPTDSVYLLRKQARPPG